MRPSITHIHSMRAWLKYVPLFLTAAFGIPAGTIYRLNIESWAQSRGLDNLIAGGASAMGDNIWGLIFVFLTIASLGAAVALWTDYGVRKFLDWRQAKNHPTRADILLRCSDNPELNVERLLDSNIYSWWWRAESALSVCIIFESEIQDPYVDVMTTIKGLAWTETQLTDRALFIRFTKKWKPGDIYIEITDSLSNKHRRRQQPNVEQEPATVDQGLMDQMMGNLGS